MSSLLNSGTGGGGSGGGSGGSSGGGTSGGFRNRVLAIVASWLVGGILAFRDQVTGLFLDATGAFIGALESGGEPVADAIAIVAGVPIDLVELLTEQLASLASMAGPFAPLVVVVAWAIAAALVLGLIQFLWWLIPLVIPWL